MHDRRDAEPGAGDQVPLELPQPGGARGGVDGAGAVGAGEVTEPVPGELFELGGPAELALQRRDRLAVLLLPEADDLGELLLERHPRRAARARAPRRRARPVVRGRTCLCRALASPTAVRTSVMLCFPWLRSCTAAAQPLTAPCRPPTICRSASVKKSRAGSIASDVKARIPAVSWCTGSRSSARPAAGCAG